MRARVLRASKATRPSARGSAKDGIHIYVYRTRSPLDDEKGRDARETRGEESESDGSVPEDLRNPLARVCVCMRASERVYSPL